MGNSYFKKPLNTWSQKTEATLKVDSKKFVLKQLIFKAIEALRKYTYVIRKYTNHQF